MRNPTRLAVAAALVVVACALAPRNAGAQGAAPGAAASAPAPDAAKPAAGRRKAAGSGTATKREPTAGQMAGRERQRKCAAEWKEAKAGGKVAAGTKWPQFYSQCNTRLKEQRA